MIKAKEINAKTQNRKLSDANRNLVLIELRRKIENNANRNNANRGLGVSYPCSFEIILKIIISGIMPVFIIRAMFYRNSIDKARGRQRGAIFQILVCPSGTLLLSKS
jgi:hypothetical protein